jgi:hypothetical protein
VYDGNAILADIEGVVVMVTEWGMGRGRGREKGTELDVETETSIVGRHDSIDSIAPALPTTPTSARTLNLI